MALCFAVLAMALLPATASAAGFCATPGKDSIGSLSSVVNTYYPGSASVSAGATSITIGASRGAATTITDGDLLLVIQMQDADINFTDGTAYGAGGASGSGSTNENQAGYYEYVRATNSVGAGGGTVNLSTGLVNSYRRRTPTANVSGASTFQVIRVPQYTSATVQAAGVTASPWNGATGGIVALDVAGTLTLTGNIDVSGQGFRGGWGENSTANGGPASAYLSRANVTGNGMKGEGIAGTPNRMNMPATFNAAPTQSTAGSLGYPSATQVDASKARGAPGNAGGGGTDTGTANDENSGGGGGGNYGAGGNGGNSWNTNQNVGGRGGGALSSVLSFNRVFLGGGGGAGTVNNNTADNTVYAGSLGNRCSAGGGNCSSGGPGGGMVLIRAQSLAGSGVIYARGGNGYNVLNDGAGGGGAGGSIVLETSLGGTVTADVSGGNGGDAWRSQDPGGYPGQRHGPGGGGSGGFIAYAPNTMAIIPITTAGSSGVTTTALDLYGGSGSVGGTYAYQVPGIPGSNTGYDCSPKLTKSYSATDIGAGASTTLTFTITNGTNNQAQSGLAFTDSFPAGLTVTAVSAISGAGCSGTPGFTASTVTLSGGAMVLDTVTCTFTATIRGDTAGTYVNDSSRLSGVSSVLSTSTMSATLNVRRVVLTKSYDSANIAETSTSTLTFTLTNGSGNPAQTNLTFTDTLATGGGLTVTGVTPLSGSGCSTTTPTFNATSNPSVTLTGATMTAGATVCTFTATVQGNSAGTYNNLSANISGASAAIDASGVNATLTVIGPPPPASGNKPLYLYDSGTPWNLSRTKPTGLTGTQTLLEGGSYTWNYNWIYSGNNTGLTSNVTISGANVPVNLWLASNSTTQNRIIEVRLACSSATGTYATSGNITRTAPGQITNTPLLTTFTLTGNLPMTCTAGNRWQLTVFNRTSGSGSRNLIVYPMSGTNNSYVNLPSQNVISVDSISLYSNSYASSGVPVALALAGSTVYIRATVSDPFGSYDINTASIAITDKDGSPVVPAVPPTAMTEIGALATAGTKTFEYPYAVPPGGPAGNWLLQVEAKEGTENLVSHTRQAIMPVVIPQPLLSVVKFANTGTAVPGQTVIYTIQVSNTGAGNGKDVLLTDDLSPYTAFGVTTYPSTSTPFDLSNNTSGLTFGTPEYYIPASGWSATTPADLGGGFNGDVTRWRLLMNGSIVPGGGFTLNYRAKVK